MDDDNKKIDCIFEEEKVFLTKSGKFYGYEKIEGGFVCRRLSNIEINRFLYRLRGDKTLISVMSVKPKRKPIPRKYEDSTLLEA